MQGVAGRQGEMQIHQFAGFIQDRWGNRNHLRNHLAGMIKYTTAILPAFDRPITVENFLEDFCINPGFELSASYSLQQSEAWRLVGA